MISPGIEARDRKRALEAVYPHEIEFARYVAQLCDGLCRRTIAEGFTESEARTMQTNLLLVFAARIAVNTRRHILKGEPDKSKFIAAADRAFSRVSAAPAPLTAPEQQEEGK